MKRIIYEVLIYTTLIAFISQPFSMVALAGCARFSSPSLYPSSCKTSCQNTCNSNCENTSDTLDLAPHCSAQKLDYTSAKFTTQNEWANTAAAITCGAVCAAEIFASLLPPVAVALNAVCSAAGGVVMGVEINSVVQVSDAGGEELDFLKNTNNLSAFFGSGASFYGLGKSGTKYLAEKAAEQAAKEATKEAVKETAEKSLLKKVAKGSCVAAPLFALAAGLSAAKNKEFKKAGAQECNYIIDHFNNSDKTSCSGNQTVSNSSGNNMSSGGATGASAQSGSTHSQSSTQDEDDSSNNSQTFTPDLLNGAFSAASEGPLGDMYKGMNDPKAIDEILKSLGTDLSDLGKRLRSEKPSQVINGLIPQLPPEMKSALTAIDDGIRDGKITSDYLGGAAVTSSGGKKPKEKGNSPTDLWTFGKRDIASSTGTSKEVKFGKSSLELDSKSTDIFHANWRGSIFELLSLKIQKVKNRLESMEWSLPLNRAFHGLSNRPVTRPSPNSEKPKENSLHPLILEEEGKKGAEQK